MIWAGFAYLYLAGGLLAICYSDQIGGPLWSLGSIILYVAWPIVVPALWISASVQELLRAIRK